MGDEEDYYETTIRPKLDKLTSSLRVEIIQQKLLQEKLITDVDDETLRLEKSTPIQRATYFLGLLKSWDEDSYMKFFQIIRESGKNCPAHRKVAQLLKLDAPETASALKLQGTKGKAKTPIQVSAKEEHPARQVHDTREEHDARRVRSIETVYPMQADTRGIALIINNKEFGPKLVNRTGTDIDASSLDGLFKWLKFKVDRKDNLTAQGIQEAIQRLAKMNHSQYNCVAVAILSYGDKDDIYGTDEKPVPVQTLTGYFKLCPSLTSKPKLFFLQACRLLERNAIQPDGIDEADATPTHTEKLVQRVLAKDQADSQLASLPTYADFLLSYATTPGFVSWGKRLRGSWYVEALVKVISEHARTEDLLSMLTIVNRRIDQEYRSTYSAGEVKIPGPVSMLTKKVKFF